MPGWKGRVEGYMVNNKQFMAKYKSRCSSHAMTDLISQLNKSQLEAVRDIGFGDLLKIKCFNSPYELLSWLIDRFDYDRRCLRVHNRDIEIREEDIERILGLKRGNINISSLLVKGEIDNKLESDLNLVVKNRMISLSELKTNMLADESSSSEFKMRFVMFVMGHFLSPTIHSSLKRSWLPLLRKVEKVKYFNLCKYVLEDLVLHIKRTQTCARGSLVYLERFSPVRGLSS
ncbi:hypothetical protein M9H77_03154 [Catharanthus roseus]|uniref:Uncharacterized protein n=1 Tax=Catharanthus roseus TaxID=4058 RepID=A0ACC0CAX4_CATRO|nr:hypothetical protein M9H77_03154 [Catharanthus roseus]